MDKINEILEFWFGTSGGTEMPSDQQTKLWFGGDARLDEKIKQQFGKDLLKAINKEYDHWLDSPRGALALVILLDQFSRHIYRNTVKAFAQDPQALAITHMGINTGIDQKLSLIERVFFYLPLEHAEDRDVQLTSIGAFKSLVDYSMPETKPIFQNFLMYALDHFKVIEQFGRFPHRNKILGRESTPAELTYLKEKTH